MRFVICVTLQCQDLFMYIFDFKVCVDGWMMFRSQFPTKTLLQLGITRKHMWENYFEICRGEPSPRGWIKESGWQSETLHTASDFTGKWKPGRLSQTQLWHVKCMLGLLRNLSSTGSTLLRASLTAEYYTFPKTTVTLFFPECVLVWILANN